MGDPESLATGHNVHRRRINIHPPTDRTYWFHLSPIMSMFFIPAVKGSFDSFLLIQISDLLSSTAGMFLHLCRFLGQLCFVFKQSNGKLADDCRRTTFSTASISDTTFNVLTMCGSVGQCEWTTFDLSPMDSRQKQHACVLME